MTSGSTLCVGQAFSRSATIRIVQPERTLDYERSKYVIKCGIKIDGEYVYTQMGVFYANKVEDSDLAINITLYDKIGQMSEAYVPTVSIPTTISAVCADICTQYSLESAVDSTTDILYFAGSTVRELLGYLAGINGSNAIINSEGKLEFRQYTGNNYTIKRDCQYSEELSLDGAFEVQSVTVQIGTDSTITAGTGVGISYTDPYCNQSRVNAVYDLYANKAFHSGKVKWFGHPEVGAGDIVTVIDKDGNSNLFIITKNTITLSGGLSMESECTGTVDSEIRFSTESPTEQKIKVVKTEMQEAIADASSLINGAKGGIFQVADSNGDGINDGWTIAENTDLSEAQKIIKANYAGIGFSTDGGQTYQTAIDYNGIVTQALHVNEIFAEDITATGTITNKSGYQSYVLDNGDIRFYYDDVLTLTQGAIGNDFLGKGYAISAPAMDGSASTGGPGMFVYRNGWCYVESKDSSGNNNTRSADNMLRLNGVPWWRTFERGDTNNFQHLYIENSTDVAGHSLFAATGDYSFGQKGANESTRQLCAGHLTESATEVWVTIRLPQKIPMDMNVSVSYLAARIRHCGGGYLLQTKSAAAYHDWVGDGYSEVRRGASEDEIVMIFKNSAWAAYNSSGYYSGTAPANNTPITLALSRIVYSISY